MVEHGNEGELNNHPTERIVLALLQLLKITHTPLVGKVIHVYAQLSTMEWLSTSKALYGRAVSFAVLLSAYHLKIKRVSEHDVDFSLLLQAFLTPSIGLDESLRHIAPPVEHSASV